MSDAPEKICLDVTSEDFDGIYMAAKPKQFANIDVEYIRADLAAEIRREALEEAAKIASDIGERDCAEYRYELRETSGVTSDNIKNAIRALQGKEGG